MTARVCLVLSVLGMIACFILAGVLDLTADQQGALMVGGLFSLIAVFIFAIFVGSES